MMLRGNINSIGCLPCNSTDIRFLKRRNYRNGEEISGCQGSRRAAGKRELGVAIKAPRRVPGGMGIFWVCTAPLSIAWCATAILLRDVTIGGNWIQVH